MASQERLSNDEFFTKLTTLFSTATSKEKNSVYLTQKPFLYSPSETPVPTPSPDQPIPLLFRATNGDKDKTKKIKISTIVEAGDLETFFARYAEVAKSGMTALKKRDRKGRKLKARKKGKKGDGEGTVATA